MLKHAKEIPAQVVCEAVMTYLKDNGHPYATIKPYKTAFYKVSRFYKCNNILLYSPAVTKNYLELMNQEVEKGSVSLNCFQRLRKFTSMTDEYYLYEHITRRCLSPINKRKLTECYQALLDNFLESIAKMHKKRTIDSKTSGITIFLCHLEDCSIFDLKSITSPMISDFLTALAERRKFSMTDIVVSIKQFLAYYVACEMLDAKLLIALDIKTPRLRKIYYGFTQDEENKILSAVDKRSTLGKRDYAMMLLASYTGLRAVDIKQLQLRDIVWETHEIRIVQSKTNKPNVLPLDNSVGNAIADYILNARPPSKDNTVFLRNSHPYIGLSDISDVVERYAGIAGVAQTTSAKISFHSFRRGVGVLMLEADVPVGVISEVLGHARLSSTKRYMALDIEHLRQCAMPMGKYQSRKEWTA